MAERVDIIVLGATGFTGKRVVKNLALLNRESEYSELTWGISGRSKEKVQNLVIEMQEWGVDISKVPVIECDIKNESSIVNVAQKAKVLMNATGPNTVLSSPVVKACIETRTHYVDISAELHHMLKIYRMYHKSAEDANVLVVPACGFGSIPALAGLIQLERHFKGTLYAVECYVELKIPKRAYLPGCGNCLVHYGTWQSLVYELQNFRKYNELKKQTFPDLEPVPEDIKKCFFHRYDGRFWIPYPGPDHDIVEMSQSYLKQNTEKKPYHFKSYTTMPLFIHFIFIIPVFLFYYFACYFACFRNLLWKYPRFFTLGYFSHEGPSKKMANDTKYSFTLNGKGWDNIGNIKSTPDKTLTVKVSGSDPGYRTTAIAFIFSAITILKEHSVMPKGGVLPSGAAFRDTQIIDRLNTHDMTFEIIEKQIV